MRLWTLVVVFWSAVAMPSAQADEVVSIQATGEARLDVDEPKTRALDAAFRQAIRVVAAPLLPSRLSAEDRSGLERDVYRRSRRFVASYRLDNQERGDDRLRVKITARVSVTRLGEVIEALGISQGASYSSTPATKTRVPRPKVVVVVRVVGTGGTRPNLKADTALEESAVGELGFEVVRASAVVTGDLSDGQLSEVAKRSGAGGAFLVEIETRTGARIRGTRLVGASATARVRVVDANRTSKVAQSEATKSAFGGDMAMAERRAGIEALTGALAKVHRPVASYWPPSTRPARGVVVVVSGARRDSAIRAIERHLAASRSKITIVARRLGAGMVSWTMESSLSARRLAALLGSVPMSSGAISARAVSAQRVRVQISDFSGSGS